MNPWAPIVGRSRHGKGPATERLLESCRASGLTLGGFVQELVPEEAGGGFDLVDLYSGERCRVARASATPDICDFAFDAGGIARGRQWLVDAAPHADVVLIEIGKLEARGEAHWAAAREALDGPPTVVVFRIRPDVLFNVADGLPDPFDGLELPADDAEVERFTAAVIEQARRS